MDGVIKAHCMGMEFPKRDTDSPNVRWQKWDHDQITRTLQEILPSAADLDAVAEEQRVKEKTRGSRTSPWIQSQS